ncbi:tRNA (adenosine(37)-N6)-threonylcarbamoyltransferase complex ATPase subunit type 1 TsaE [Alienimonas californiensis]|uniref:tRNA threonylcarbamoyladenosine biosynthesis protein TsaE n=1 Tax=Alienimonas californiensis TaxID=2527989 RepID=A0A517P9N2_9PLAN|nr:tRNA (adenosine(37)-N6)-threonylcarbamoyltransferase complex ATPase subunit type 1 TsaE [Alienimonas californiensis]QDT16080.1 tRNA threonylcarbamoyladenosine biosynthesis protein TsaE [Alienimonas californiensis]
MPQSLHNPPAASPPDGTALAGGADADSRTAAILTLSNETDTDRLGRVLASLLRVGSVVGLNGELGAGKTRLVRAVALACGVEPEQIGSPTFTLVREYVARTAPRVPAELRLPPLLFHLDAYRLADEDDYLNLGPEEFIESGAMLIEWAERVDEVLPTDRLTLSLAATGETSRSVALSAGGPDSRRLRDAILAAFDPASLPAAGRDED